MFYFYEAEIMFCTAPVAHASLPAHAITYCGAITLHIGYAGLICYFYDWWRQHSDNCRNRAARVLGRGHPVLYTVCLHKSLFCMPDVVQPTGQLVLLS